MIRIRSRIAVGDHHGVSREFLFPFCFPRNYSVGAEEHRRRIRVHVVRALSKLAAEVHPHRRASLAFVIGKAHRADAVPLPLEGFGKKQALRSLAASVKSFYCNKLWHFKPPPPLHPDRRTFYLISSSRMTISINCSLEMSTSRGF